MIDDDPFADEDDDTPTTTAVQQRVAAGASPWRRFEVTMPAGGRLTLFTQDEVDLWETWRQQYEAEYTIENANDRLVLGTLLTQHVAAYRSQQSLMGFAAEFDEDTGHPTGRMARVKSGTNQQSRARNALSETSKEIRELERALGTDKKSREAGGAHTVDQYVATLKEAAREYGLHLSKRLLAYEQVATEARWKLRLLRDGDDEDRAYENVSEKTVLEWLAGELERLEEVDRTWAREKGKIFVGKVR